MHVYESYGDQNGCETLTPTASTGITSTLIAPTTGAFAGLKAKFAVIKALTCAVNFRMDGTAPTASTGMNLTAGDSWIIEGTPNIVNFRCIDTADGASTVRVMLFF